MEDTYRKAFSEVLEVLKHTEKEIVEKIPDKFIDFLNKNKDENYVCDIDFYDENWDENVEKETLAIIAMIYRDYIVSPEEKQKLITEEQEELKRVEQELNEKYSYDNLFKKKTEIKEPIDNSEDNSENLQMVEYKEEGFFKRLINKIIKFFKR